MEKDPASVQPRYHVSEAYLMMPAGRARRIEGCLAVAVILFSGRSLPAAPPAAPPPPEKYQVHIRYRIDAGRTQRLAQYFAMTRYFESIGFFIDPTFDDDPADPYETRLRGTIPSNKANLLFADPHVKAVLLIPAGYQVPDDPEAAVKVQLQLVPGLSPDRQWAFAEQVRNKLVPLGFKEAVGYHHRGHTRMVGTIPAGQLETPLKDLRWQPSGWFAPVEPFQDLPAPLRTVSPIRVVEVLPEPPDMPPARADDQGPPLRPDDPAQKLTPDVRALRSREEQPRPQRMEVILAYNPPRDDAEWRRELNRAIPGLVIEGRLGPVVTVVINPKRARALAELPVVSVVRLPRPALMSLIPPWNGPDENQQAIRASGLERLHGMGFRGRGIRVAVVDSDFQGYERLKTAFADRLHLVDFTAARNRSLEPDPFPTAPPDVGSGTQAGLVLALVAPDADLTLIRIDPAAPHHLGELARWLDGEVVDSASMNQRQAELEADDDRLRRRREQLTTERNALLNEFGEDEETIKKKAEHFRKVTELERDGRALLGRKGRYLDLWNAQYNLKHIQVVSSALVWSSGYPVGGNSPLSRYFADHPLRHALWFQSADNTRNQAWAGLFHDADGNGVMEFAPRGTPLRPERWTAELNFLAWQPVGKTRTPDLPAKARMRVSIQWREVHDPEVSRFADDPYRQPLANLGLVVLRQRDPTGTKLPADDLDVVARSGRVARRLDNEAVSATYEQTVEFTVDPAGRYAVRVEGRKPTGTRPAEVPSLPATERTGELWPRLFVEALDGPSRLAGRPVFLDYVTDRGTLGVPADAAGVLTIAAADRSGQPRPYSTVGPPLNRDLMLKPDAWAFDGFRLGLGGSVEIYGSTLATPFAAGLTAAALSAGNSVRRWGSFLRAHPGLIRIP
jgi:hypothetical protein